MDSLYKTKDILIDRSLSFSKLKDFAENGPKALIKRPQLTGYALSLGNLTDDFLDERVKVRDKYIVYDGAKPTATLGKLCNLVLENYRKLPSKKKVLKLVQQNHYWSNIVDIQTLINKFDLPEFWDYLKVQYKSEKEKKPIVTTDMYIEAEDMALLIKTHKHTSYLFDNNYKRVYQYFFKIKINSVIFRGAIDYIAIDDDAKTVQIIDFKTGKDPAIDFPKTFIKYRYYLQAAIYLKAFRSICAKFKLKGYKLLPFKFIYFSKGENVPIVYTVTKKWHKAGIEGFTTSYGYRYRGLNELIDDVVWHYHNRVFEMPRFLSESQGQLEIEDNFINVTD